MQPCLKLASQVYWASNKCRAASTSFKWFLAHSHTPQKAAPNVAPMGVSSYSTRGRSPDMQAIEDEIAINLMGRIRLIALLLPVLREAPESMIVNVTSGLCYAPFPATPVYCATKAAMHAFTQSLRIQLGRTNISVVEILPPSVDTPMIEESMRQSMKGQKMASPKDIAHISITRIQAGDREIRIGASNMLYWLSRLAPGMLGRQMVSAYNALR